MMMTNERMDDGEFWLPSDFLSDDFFAGEERMNETESDEDDSMAGLTRQLQAHSLLSEEHKIFNGEVPKASVMGTSPQSTLCGMGGWSFSSSGSPEGPSQVSSPPSTPFPQPSDDALDLLYAAAGQVELLGLNGRRSYQERSYQIPEAVTKNQRLGAFYTNRDLIQQQLQAARFYQLRRQQLLKQQQLEQYYAAWERQKQQQQQPSRARSIKSHASAYTALPPLQKARHNQQPQPSHGSELTAVFLNGARRKSNGTGVFLPRRAGTPVESKKKPGCSTVLLPARVVHALNLNLDGSAHSRLPGYVRDNNNDGLMAGNNLKRNYAAVVAASPETRLPQEWTY